MKSLASSLLAVTLASGCSASGSGTTDAAVVDPCPSAAPADGAACTVPAQHCVYAHCASEGVVSARCDAAGDGGTAHWTVTTTPCTGCGGTTDCTGEALCVDHVGGALIGSCSAHTCGTGPLDCACVCGEGVDCQIYPSAQSDGAWVACQTGCGASICP